jgi:isocitrate/isopropylmalate dehydrogenase
MTKKIVALGGEGIGPEVVKRPAASCRARAFPSAMMLEHVGLAREANRLEGTVARLYRERTTLTPDQGGTATTEEFSRAVLASLD